MSGGALRGWYDIRWRSAPLVIVIRMTRPRGGSLPRKTSNEGLTSGLGED